MARILALAPIALAGLSLAACASTPRQTAYYAQEPVVVGRAPLPFDPRPLPPNTVPGDCVAPLSHGDDYHWARIDCVPAYAQAGYSYAPSYGGGSSSYYEAGGDRYSSYGATSYGTVGGYSRHGSGYSYSSGSSTYAPSYSYSSGYAYGPGYSYSYGHDPRASNGMILGGPMSGGVGYGGGWGYDGYAYAGHGYGQGVTTGGYGYPPAWGGYRSAGRDAYGYLVWPSKTQYRW